MGNNSEKLNPLLDYFHFDNLISYENILCLHSLLLKAQLHNKFRNLKPFNLFFPCETPIDTPISRSSFIWSTKLTKVNVKKINKTKSVLSYISFFKHTEFRVASPINFSRCFFSFFSPSFIQFGPVMFAEERSSQSQ